MARCRGWPSATAALSPANTDGACSDSATLWCASAKARSTEYESSQAASARSQYHSGRASSRRARSAGSTPAACAERCLTAHSPIGSSS